MSRRLAEGTPEKGNTEIMGWGGQFRSSISLSCLTYPWSRGDGYKPPLDTSPQPYRLPYTPTYRPSKDVLSSGMPLEDDVSIETYLDPYKGVVVSPGDHT